MRLHVSANVCNYQLSSRHLIWNLLVNDYFTTKTFVGKSWVLTLRCTVNIRVVQIWYQVYLRNFTHQLMHFYTRCPRRNVPDIGRVFLMLKYTDITQNTYVQIWTVTELMAREVWNFDSCYTLIDYQIHIKTGRNMWFL